MKKMLVGFAAVVAAAAVNGASVSYTPEEYDAKCDAVYEMAQTNLVMARRLFETNGISTILSRKDLIAKAKSIDERLSAVGIRSAWYFATCPTCVFRKLGQNAFDFYGAESNSPVRVALARKYETYASCYWITRSNATMDEMIPVLSEMCQESSYFNSAGEMTQMKTGLQRSGEKVVKKYLRAQGKSFVTKDGVNPCATYMEDLNKALNAPYFDGLNAWLEQMGCSARVDVSKLMTKADAEKLKNDILNADVDMTTSHQYMLQLCLGVDGYNAFVKEYNGDK